PAQSDKTVAVVYLNSPAVQPLSLPRNPWPAYHNVLSMTSWIGSILSTWWDHASTCASPAKTTRPAVLFTTKKPPHSPSAPTNSFSTALVAAPGETPSVSSWISTTWNSPRRSSPWRATAAWKYPGTTIAM